jgi:hypothetical protein
MNYEKYIIRQLKSKGFTEKQVQDVLDIVIDLFPKEQDDSLSLIRYAEKKFYDKFGDVAVFCTYPMAPQVMRRVTEFKSAKNLTGDKYRKFIEWIMLDGEPKLNRLPILYDLYNSKLFSIFEKQGDSLVVEEKKKIQKRKLLII